MVASALVLRLDSGPVFFPIVFFLFFSRLSCVFVLRLPFFFSNPKKSSRRRLIRCLRFFLSIFVFPRSDEKYDVFTVGRTSNWFLSRLGVTHQKREDESTRPFILSNGRFSVAPQKEPTVAAPNRTETKTARLEAKTYLPLYRNLNQ